MNQRIVIASITLLLVGSAFSCKYVMPERYVDYNKGRMPVNLPRDLKNSDRDSNVEKESAIIITLTGDGRIYLGTDHAPTEAQGLSAKIKRLVEARPEPEEDRIAYLAVDVDADYGRVVALCDEIRKIDSVRVGLLVTRANDDWPSRLLVELSPEPNPNEDLSNLRPNPLMLVAALTPDIKVTLNAQPMGEANDLDALSQKLLQVFRLRLEQHAYRPGYETRVDVPESDRIEKTIMIRAPKQVKYGDVVKVIDAVKGAGANPIVLQLDEMRVFPIQERNH